MADEDFNEEPEEGNEDMPEQESNPDEGKKSIFDDEDSEDVFEIETPDVVKGEKKGKSKKKKSIIKEEEEKTEESEEKSSESKEKPAEKETLFALRTTANREDQVMDFVVSNVEKKKMDVWAVIRPHGMRGYVFIEAATRADAEQAAFNIPYARGILPKPVNYSEIDHMLEQVKIEKNIRKNDIVEIIAGPFKREQAKIARIDKQKEEVVVELLEAAIPIPITVKMDNVKVIRRDSESTEEEEERKEFTLPNQKKKVKEAEIPPEMDDEDEEQ